MNFEQGDFKIGDRVLIVSPNGSDIVHKGHKGMLIGRQDYYWRIKCDCGQGTWNCANESPALPIGKYVLVSTDQICKCKNKVAVLKKMMGI